MIRQQIGKRLRKAAIRLLEDRHLARLLAGTPISVHADRDLIRSQRRYARWCRIWTVLYGWDTTPSRWRNRWH